MLVVGAKGLAKELLDILHQNKELKDLVFYDDINDEDSGMLYEKFPVIKSLNEAHQYLKEIDQRFTLGLGNTKLRYNMCTKFMELGGKLTSVISTEAKIGLYDVFLEPGVAILAGAVIANGVQLGTGTLVYNNAVITHDVTVGEFCEISPSANLLGRCSVGSFTHIGANATVLPDIVIGSNVKVASGAVVTKGVPDNCMVAGVPAQIKKPW